MKEILTALVIILAILILPNKIYANDLDVAMVKTQDDITSLIIRTNTVDSLMIFSNQGKMYRLLVDNIPEGTNTSKGMPVINLPVDLLENLIFKSD